MQHLGLLIADGVSTVDVRGACDDAPDEMHAVGHVQLGVRRAKAKADVGVSLHRHTVAGDRYLDVINVPAIPDGFENSVGEAERHDVLDGFFAEVVVDAVDLFFADNLQELLVERTGGIDVAAERLLDNDRRH